MSKYKSSNTSCMDFKLLIIILVLPLFLTACMQHSENKKQDFFSYDRRGDLYRLPVLEPIEVYSADGYFWNIDLPYKGLGESKFENSIAVDQIGTTDSLVIAYADRISFQSQMTSLWLVIDLANETERFFTNANAYQQFVSEKQKTAPSLYEINEIYPEFKESGLLPYKK